MTGTASLDSRVVLTCLSAAGLTAADSEILNRRLGAMLCGRDAAKTSAEYLFKTAGTAVNCRVTLEILWDAIGVTLESEHGQNFDAVLDRFSKTHDPEIQTLLKQKTFHGLKALDEQLLKAGTRLEALRQNQAPINPAVTETLLRFFASSVDRVIHEEIAGLMCLPIQDKSVRVLLGEFLIRQFPLPAKRTYRFILCQALANLAEPEFLAELARLAMDKHYASLRGGLCGALAKTGHPDAASHIAAVLADCDDETKLCAIEALGSLKASQYTEVVRSFLNYQSSDKEWTRVIKKAAEKALKAF